MKKLLALLLALLMLVPLVVSCANNNSDSEGESTTKSTASENGTNETDTGEKVDVPDTKYGKDLTFLCFNDSGEWSVVDIYTEKDSDDVLKSAIFQRNLYLKDTYDVTIKEVQEKDIAAKAKTEQASNSDAYQAYIAPLPRSPLSRICMTLPAATCPISTCQNPGGISLQMPGCLSETRFILPQEIC